MLELSPRILAAVALVSSAGCDSCTTPSQHVDGKELLGVFDRDAGADGGVVALEPTAGASASAAPRQAIARPPQASCVEPSGAPNEDVRRTVRRPACRRGRVLEWQDPSGAPRYACVFAPADLEKKKPLPVIVFFHPEDADPTSLRKRTNLRTHARDFDMTGDPDHQGYILLAPQGRAIHGGERGVVFDAEYTGDDNVDLVTVDHFVGVLEGEGLIDRRRVYAVGAGHGGTMAVTYAMVRADRVAAFAAFAPIVPRAKWSCPTPPPPGVVLYRDCDAVADCDGIERWLEARDQASAATLALRINAGDKDAPYCAVNKCGKKLGTANHHRWPKHREVEMLEFLAARTLSLGR